MRVSLIVLVAAVIACAMGSSVDSYFIGTRELVLTDGTAPTSFAVYASHVSLNVATVTVETYYRGGGPAPPQVHDLVTMDVASGNVTAQDLILHTKATGKCVFGSVAQSLQVSGSFASPIGGGGTIVVAFTYEISDWEDRRSTTIVVPGLAPTQETQRGLPVTMDAFESFVRNIFGSQ